MIKLTNFFIILLSKMFWIKNQKKCNYCLKNRMCRNCFKNEYEYTDRMATLVYDLEYFK